MPDTVHENGSRGLNSGRGEYSDVGRSGSAPCSSNLPESQLPRGIVTNWLSEPLSRFCSGYSWSSRGVLSNDDDDDLGLAASGGSSGCIFASLVAGESEDFHMMSDITTADATDTVGIPGGSSSTNHVDRS